MPDGNALVQELVGKQRHREDLLDSYTYDVVEIREELDAAGRAKSRRSRRFEVFYVRGRPVRKLVALDDRPLSPEAQAKEDRRVSEAARAIGRGEVVTEQPGIRLSAVLERYDFRTLGREAIEGRSAFLLEFRPRPGTRDLDSDGVLRNLTGHVWVDEAEHEVVRARIRNVTGFKVRLGAVVSALDVTLEFRKVGGEVWLPLKVESEVQGRLMLVKGFRRRSIATYGSYQRFRVEAEEQVRPLASPSPR